MSYQQLTEGRRYQISTLLELVISISGIAQKVKCHRATVYRELKRNRADDQYCPKKAHSSSVNRRKTANKYRIPVERIEWVCLLLAIDWSPEQIACVLTRAGAPVSHEWIYHYIDGRSSIVDSRERFGDWEIDTVLGKHGTGAIVTILERKSRFYLAKKVSSKSANAVTKATLEMLMPYKNYVHTITADNGKEFAGHQEIAEALEAKLYFTHPYSSWERGVNENANGLLRQYVKKGTDLRTVTDNDIEFAQSRLNLRPKSV